MPDIELEYRGTIAVITLNRPAKSNALTAAMMADIASATDEINSNPDVCAAVITGTGKAFCGGRDADELRAVKSHLGAGASQPSQASVGEAAKTGQESSALRRIEVPLIAAVNGAAVGAGLGMVLQCDRAVAAASALLWDGHLANGMVTSVASWYLPNKLGIGRALEFATLAKGVPAADLAAQLDLEIVPEPADALPRALTLAAVYTTYPAALIRQTKAAFLAGSSYSFDDTMSVVGSLRAQHASAATGHINEQQRIPHADR